METGERLAAYLAGELDADETRALEAELARDPRLRAKLEAIRSTDAALASLPVIEPPAGFSERLRAAVRTELDDHLPADGDELAARRARRRGTAGTGGTRSWWPQVAVAAAVLAVAGIGITQLGQGGADSGEEAALESADTTAEMAPMEAAAGPTVVAAGRTFDAESLRDLADDTRFDELVDRGLAGPEAAAAADEFQAEIQGDAPADGGARIASDDAGDADAAAGSGPAGDFGLRTVGDVSDEDLAVVRRCLDELLATETTVIPAYAELIEFEGQDAIVYGLVGNDPEQESYRRVELWVVGRGDCQVLHFTQVDR